MKKFIYFFSYFIAFRPFDDGKNELSALLLSNNIYKDSVDITLSSCTDIESGRYFLCKIFSFFYSQNQFINQSFILFISLLIYTLSIIFLYKILRTFQQEDASLISVLIIISLHRFNFLFANYPLLQTSPSSTQIGNLFLLATIFYILKRKFKISFILFISLFLIHSTIATLFFIPLCFITIYKYRNLKVRLSVFFDGINKNNFLLYFLIFFLMIVFINLRFFLLSFEDLELSSIYYLRHLYHFPATEILKSLLIILITIFSNIYLINFKVFKKFSNLFLIFFLYFFILGLTSLFIVEDSNILIQLLAPQRAFAIFSVIIISFTCSIIINNKNAFYLNLRKLILIFYLSISVVTFFQYYVQSLNEFISFNNDIKLIPERYKSIKDIHSENEEMYFYLGKGITKSSIFPFNMKDMKSFGRNRSSSSPIFEIKNQNYSKDYECLYKTKYFCITE